MKSVFAGRVSRFSGLALSLCALTALAACTSGQAPSAVAQMPDAARSVTSGAASELAYWADQYRVRPGDRDIALRYSARLRQLGMLPQAIQVIAEARRVMPTAPDLATEEARIHLEMGKADKALDVLQPLADDPSMAEKHAWAVLNLIGIAHDRAGRGAAAQAAYERALVVAPGHPTLLNNYALSRLLQGDTEGAEAILARVELIEQANPTPEQVMANLNLITQLKNRQVADTPETFPSLRLGQGAGS